jgi:hypothetical protein
MAFTAKQTVIERIENNNSKGKWLQLKVQTDKGVKTPKVFDRALVAKIPSTGEYEMTYEKGEKGYWDLKDAKLVGAGETRQQTSAATTTVKAAGATKVASVYSGDSLVTARTEIAREALRTTAEIMKAIASGSDKAGLGALRDDACLLLRSLLAETTTFMRGSETKKAAEPAAAAEGA